MRVSSVRAPVASPTTPASLPISLQQSAPRTWPILMIGVLLPVSVALVLPFLLVAQHLALDPATRAIVASRPHVAFQLILALGFFAALFGWPLVRLAKSLTYKRFVEIDGQNVRVTERSLSGRSSWSEPLDRYAGLSHHVRSSLSGLRHELLLAHPDPSRAVLIAAADRISRTEIEDIAQLLNVAEIPSREGARSMPISGLLGPAGLQPRLDAARV